MPNYLWGLAGFCVAALLLIRVACGRKQKRLELELTREYPLTYRIKCLPADVQCVLRAEGASIEIGDLGWQAEPLRGDGRVYLHGLNDRWQVVWYDGFRPDQV